MTAIALSVSQKKFPLRN